MGIPTRGRFAWALAAAAAAGTAAADCGGGCGGSLSGTPADEFVAERLGLVREWVVQLPFDSTRASLEHVTIGDGLVVAQTGDGGVHAVRTAGGTKPQRTRLGDPAPGSLLWSRRLETNAGASTPPGVGPHLVTTTRDLHIFALDRHTGDTRWERPLGQPSGVGSVEIDDWVYVPLSGGGVRRLTFDPLQPTADATAPAAGKPAKGRKPKPQAAEAAKPTAESLRPRTFDSGGPVARPVRSLGNGVVWSTTDGVLVSLQQSDLNWERHEFGLNSPAVDAPVTRGSAVFAATQAADLARIELLESGGTGLRTRWHVVLHATPDSGPFLGGDAVVVSLGETGLAAFAAETGAELWRNATAGRVLAVVGDRVWIIDRTGRLAGVDLATGQRREVVCLGGFSFPIVNTETDRLLLASPDGVLVSLAPRRPATVAKPAPAKPPVKAPPAAAPAAAEAAEEG